MKLLQLISLFLLLYIDCSGRKLSEYETEEKVVLKLITRVFAARKAVRLRIEEEEEEAM